MAKELPYFKFEPNAWDNGNIQMLSREEKGLFIDICSMYWSRLGDIPLKLVIQKLCAGNATALKSLCDEKIIEVIDGNIFIKFLSEQLNEFEDVSKQNSKNAKEGWEKRRKQKEESDRNATALKSQSENDAIREDKSKEEDIKEEKKIDDILLKKETKKVFKEENEINYSLPFSEKFKVAWKKWIDYKKSQFRFTYKTQETINTALWDLVKKSKDNEDNAILIINNSIANGYKGLFELKNLENGKPSNITATAKPKFRKVFSNLANQHEQAQTGNTEGELFEDTEYTEVE